MNADELMTVPVQVCQPDTDLATVTKLMWDHDCGFVPVVDTEGHVAGVVTDRDICIAAATRRALVERMSASQVMSHPVHACGPTDKAEDVLATMSRFQVRRLPVVDAQGHLHGIVSVNDVIRAVGRKGAPTAATVVAALSGICARGPTSLAS